MRRFGGTFQSGGLLRRCHVRFRYGQTWVTVTPGSRRGHRRSMQVSLQWPDGRMDWRLASRDPMTNRWTPRRPARDSLPVTWTFDQRYRVTGRHDR